MAVTLTVDQLRNALRTGDTPEETTEITRLLGYVSAVVDREVGIADVPQVVQNEAAIRVAAYLYDMPAAARGTAYANVFRNSGAAAMLLPYRTHGATSTGAESGESGTAAGTAAGLPQTATPDEAQEGTSNFLRSWTAALIRTAINAVVPNPGPSHAGRVFSIGSDGTRFWDLAGDVLLRAVGSLTGQKGKFLVVNQAEDDIELDGDVAALARIPASALPDPAAGTRGHFLKQSDTDETYVFDQAAGVVDQTARTAAAAAQVEADQNTGDVQVLQTVTRDLHRVDLPGTWAKASDGKIAVRAATSTEIRPPEVDASAWNTATAEFVQTVTAPTGQGEHTTPRVTVTVQLPANADRADYRVRRVNAGTGTSAEGIVSPNRWSGLSGSSFGFPDGFLYYSVYVGAVDDQWDTVTWTLEKHSEDVHATEFDGVIGNGRVTLDALAAAVAARLLPTGAAEKQIAQYDGSEWKAITPDAGGIGPPTSYTEIVSNPTKDAMGAWNLTGSTPQAGAEASAVFNAYVSGSYRWIAFVNIDSDEIEYHVVIPVLPATASGLAIGSGRTVEHSYVSNASPSNDQHGLSGYFRIANSSGTKNAFLTVNRLGSGGVLGFNRIIGIP